jgi:hypothetical protein
VATAKTLDRTEKEELERLGSVVLPKAVLSTADAESALADALRRACDVTGRPALVPRDSEGRP